MANATVGQTIEHLKRLVKELEQFNPNTLVEMVDTYGTLEFEDPTKKLWLNTDCGTCPIQLVVENA